MRESCWVPFTPRSLSQPSALPLFSLPSFLAQPGPHAGYGHFAEVYSQLQPYKSEQPLGAVSGPRFLRHWAHAGTDQVGNAAARGEGLRADPEPRLGPFPKRRRPRLHRARSKEGSLPQNLPGAQPAGLGRPKGDPWPVPGE